VLGHAGEAGEGLRRLAERLGVAERVEWRYKVPHREVAAWLAHAELSVAPLSDCARNVDQGCCPLKVLESMAVGTCVVASDLAVTRELVEDGRHGVLVAPGRPAELARAIRVALEYPDHTAELGRNGQARVAGAFTWTRPQRLAAAPRPAADPSADPSADPECGSRVRIRGRIPRADPRARARWANVAARVRRSTGSRLWGGCEPPPDQVRRFARDRQVARAAALH
jgi:hypothetical protein